MKINKAVIPVAGFGTRMLPAAKASPKELLPVLDRPTVQYVVEEAADANVSDVLLITARDKRAIEDHFDLNQELDARLKTAGREHLLAGLNALIHRVKIHAVRQGEARGLGHAVSRARHFAGVEPFLCLLGDTIFSGAPSPASQLTAVHEKYGHSVVGLERVSAQNVHRYGIVGGKPVGEGVYRLDTLIEKPSRESAPSDLAIAARYVLTPAIFGCLDETAPGKGGEVQLTDAMRLLLEREPVYGVVLGASRHDIGNPVDWLKTNILYASRDPALWKEIEPLLRKLIG